MYYNKSQWENLVDAYEVSNDPLVNNRSIEDILKSSESSLSDDNMQINDLKKVNYKGLSTRRKYSIMAKLHGPIASKKMRGTIVEKDYDKKVVDQYIKS